MAGQKRKLGRGGGPKQKKRKSDQLVTKPANPTEEKPARRRSLTGLILPQEQSHEDDKQELAVDNVNGQLNSPVFRNKEKVLVVCSRRITYRNRHLMMDLMGLLPHGKKDVKVQAKDDRASTLNELADLKGCTSCLFFECRKKLDLYLWISKCPGGPSAKFLVNSVHTMAELKLTGNHLKGSRPILSFSSVFDKQPHLQLLKELFMQVFCTPKDHRKSKPFFDHVIVFSIVDNHIWFRNYQISVPHHGTETLERGSLDKMTLIEVGPRFCLNPIKIFSSSFSGQTLYENPYYVSPNLIRSLAKRKKAGKYNKKVKAKVKRKTYLSANQLEPNELTGVWEE